MSHCHDGRGNDHEEGNVIPAKYLYKKYFKHKDYTTQHYIAINLGRLLIVPEDLSPGLFHVNDVLTGGLLRCRSKKYLLPEVVLHHR